MGNPALPFDRKQVAALAPDAKSLSAAEGLVRPGKWSGLGRDDAAVWGECAGSGKNPYLVQVDLSGPAFKCSCPSRKFPCKHGLALLLLAAGDPAAVPAGAAPPRVTDWLAARRARAEKAAAAPAATAAPADPEAQAKRARAREKKVAAGVAELALRLSDLVREGLATVATRPPSEFDALAARMTDAQAPGLARLAREIGARTTAGPHGPQGLLAHVARLHLLLRAWERQDELAPDVRAGVRSLVGFAESKEEVLAGDGVRDRWLVVGRRTSVEDRLTVTRTWLFGEGTGRFALDLSFSAPGRAPEAPWLPGTAVESELAFYPGPASLRALEKKRHAGPEPFGAMPFAGGIAAAVAAAAEGFRADPFGERRPVGLVACPVPDGASLAARDEEGREVPLRIGGDGRLRLLALSGGRPRPIFGEWDGVVLRPLSVFAEGEFVDLAAEEAP